MHILTPFGRAGHGLMPKPQNDRVQHDINQRGRLEKSEKPIRPQDSRCNLTFLGFSFRPW
jgi:hypothetical protein